MSIDLAVGEHLRDLFLAKRPLFAPSHFISYRTNGITSRFRRARSR
jgi:hypothetical protein